VFAVAAVRRSVAEAHELRVSAVVLIRKSTLDKTSGGKIQRSASRARFADGTLDVVASWRSTRPGRQRREPAGRVNSFAPAGTP
jgi:hypothetical protein